MRSFICRVSVQHNWFNAPTVECYVPMNLHRQTNFEFFATKHLGVDRTAPKLPTDKKMLTNQQGIEVICSDYRN